MSSRSIAEGHGRTTALWACPFRPFFLATAVYAILVMIFWLGIWFAGWPLPEGFSPMQWHSHEMLFGMVSAAIAGFLLTAMCNWTGARPLSGTPLMGLFGLWLAGRLAMWTASWLPDWLVAVIDLSFLPVVAIYAGRVILAAGNYRNLALVAVLTLLAIANAGFHLGVWNEVPVLARRTEMTTMVLVVLLLAIIGGRITPAFTRNWLKRAGRDATAVRTRPWVEFIAVGAIAVLLALVLAGVPERPIAIVALIGAAANALRLAGWRGWKAASDPLMWILHAGYAWIPLGLGLMGLAPWFAAVSDTAWIHAIGAGAMSVMIIGVMTRVGLGHTGRPLSLPAAAMAAYWLILAGAVIRVGAALTVLPHATAVVLSGAAWIGAFGVFLVVYGPILSQPRADGRPG